MGLLAGVIGPSTSRAGGRLELDPPKAIRKLKQDPRARFPMPVMVPSKMNLKSLEMYFDKESAKQRTEKLRNRITTQRSRAQAAAIARAEATGRTVDGRPASISNPVMSAFAKLVEDTSAEDRELMKGVDVIALQHLLGTTGSLLRSFVKLGAKPVDIVALGKRYSQHAGVMDELTRDGFRIRPAEREEGADLDVGIDDWGRGNGKPMAGLAQFNTPRRGGRAQDRQSEIERSIAQLVKEVGMRKAKGSTAKVLVIDDGGELIERIQREHPELHEHIVAVEQTRRGIRKVEALNLSFPVIDVAQTDAKLQFESPMIGLSIAKTTMERIARLEDAGQIVPRRILSVGHGAVGSAASAELRRAGFEVQVYDRSPYKRYLARKQGYRVYETMDEALAKAHVVLGTTGEPILTGDALDKLPEGTVLINGASSGTEFMPDKMAVLRGSTMNSVQLVGDTASVFASYRGKRLHLGDLKRDSRLAWGKSSEKLDYPIMLLDPNTRAKKMHLLLNQGEVINFDGSVDPIPPRYIQLTRGLLFLASVQALKTTSAGIHKLDDDAQKRWVDAVRAELATTGESLEKPRF